MRFAATVRDLPNGISVELRRAGVLVYTAVLAADGSNAIEENTGRAALSVRTSRPATTRTLSASVRTGSSNCASPRMAASASTISAVSALRDGRFDKSSSARRYARGRGEILKRLALRLFAAGRIYFSLIAAKLAPGGLGQFCRRFAKRVHRAGCGNDRSTTTARQRSVAARTAYVVERYR